MIWPSLNTVWQKRGACMDSNVFAAGSADSGHNWQRELDQLQHEFGDWSSKQSHIYRLLS